MWLKKVLISEKRKHLVGVLKGQNRHDTQKSQLHSEIRHSSHPLLTNPYEMPQFHTRNYPALNLMHCDTFLPCFKCTFDATNCNIVYVCLQNSPILELMQIDAFPTWFHLRLDLRMLWPWCQCIPMYFGTILCPFLPFSYLYAQLLRN